jgi:N-acetylneuraminic acid mutarotase
MKILLQFLFTAAMLALSGCGGGGGGDNGVAPTISALSFSPTTAYVNDGGGQIDVIGTLDFTDPNGDLSSVTITVLDSIGQTVVSQEVPVSGATGITAGTIQGTITISTATAGDYTVQVYASDIRGLSSNVLQDIFRITDFPWVSMTAMPTPRLRFVTANVGGKIYVLGGQDASSPIIPQPPMTTVEIYDPATDSWSTGTPMPFAVSAAMAAVVNGKIYVIGGVPELAIASDAVQEYNPATDTWTIKTSMIDSRYSAAVAMYNNLIYIAGGSGPGTTLASLLWFDPAMNVWSAGSPMSQVRTGSAGAAIGDQILLYGGYNTQSSYLGSVEDYDPALDTWTTRASTGIERRDMGVSLVNGLLYAFGGNNVNRSLDLVSAYDSATDTWTSKTPMPVSLDYTRAELVNGKVYVFGTNNTLEYTPSNDAL